MAATTQVRLLVRSVFHMLSFALSSDTLLFDICAVYLYVPSCTAVDAFADEQPNTFVKHALCVHVV